MPGGNLRNGLIPPEGTNCKGFYNTSPVKIGMLFQGDLFAKMSLEKCFPGTPFTELSLPDSQTLLQPRSKWLLLQLTAGLAPSTECCGVFVVLFCFIFAESAGVTRALEAQREDFKGKQGQGVSLTG